MVRKNLPLFLGVNLCKGSIGAIKEKSGGCLIKLSVKPALLLVTCIFAFIFLSAKQTSAHQACLTGSFNGTYATAMLCAANSPYTMTGDVSISAGGTLTIEPGVIIEVKTPVQGSGKLTINGTLIAEGTAAAPIRFTSGWTTFGSPQKGDWGNIEFTSTSSNNVLTYATVEHASNFDPAMIIRTGSLTMSNSTIANNGDDGIFIANGSPTLENTSFTNNTDRPLIIGDDAYPVLSSLIANGNGFDGVTVSAETISQDMTWGAGLSTYRIAKDTTVSENIILTVNPGSKIEFRTPVRGSSGKLTVNGTLQANGTANNPVSFTSGWGSAQKNDWENIVFTTNSSNNSLNYVTVEYASRFRAAVEINTGSFSMMNSTIANNGRDGVQVNSGTPTITNNNIQNNDGAGLINNSTATTVNAACNWWGSADGPEAGSNPSGNGQQVSGSVTFSPWLVAPAPAGTCTGKLPNHLMFLPMIVR